MAEQTVTNFSVSNKVTFGVKSSFKFNEVAFANFVKGETGDVQRFLKVAIIAAKEAAPVLAKQRLSDIGGPRHGKWHRAGNNMPDEYPGRTGEYDKRFHYRNRTGIGSIRYTLYNTSPYAAIVERGTLKRNYPIRIKGRGKRKLVYFSEGAYFFKREVIHPGPWRTNPARYRKVGLSTGVGPGANIMNDALVIGFRTAKKVYVRRIV